MQNAQLAEYAEITNEIKKLEERRAALNDKILKQMIDEARDTLESPIGRFTVGHKLSWIYSQALTKAEEQLKIKKLREQDKGVAKATDKPYLLYHAPKIK